MEVAKRLIVSRFNITLFVCFLFFVLSGFVLSNVAQLLEYEHECNIKSNLIRHSYATLSGPSDTKSTHLENIKDQLFPFTLNSGFDDSHILSFLLLTECTNYFNNSYVFSKDLKEYLIISLELPTVNEDPNKISAFSINDILSCYISVRRYHLRL